MNASVGIDIGAQKGFHAVALDGNTIVDVLHTTCPGDLLSLCIQFGASAVAVDAPCRWRTHQPRECERALYRLGIHCFWTPTLEVAETHPTDYYGWMKNGMRVYQEIFTRYPLLHSGTDPSAPVCMETFPHAVVMRIAQKDPKNRQFRRSLLDSLGIDTRLLIGSDFVDAALCALTARLYLEGKTDRVGDDAGGWMVLPLQDTSTQPQA